MGQYCDTNVLEENWFHWILSSSVPDLEVYRNYGLLWTRVLDTVKRDDGTEILKRGKPLLNPSYSTRAHCIALGYPVHLNSYHGVPQSRGTARVDGKMTSVELSQLSSELSLHSDFWIHNLDRPFAQSDAAIRLIDKGYIREKPTEISWHAMLADINQMCQGIATKFKPSTEEELMDLANEALVQVSKKLVTGKLVYIPGKAPVFNLLTTTIHRCMFSIMNRRTNRRQGLNKLLQDAQAGILPDSQRSLRTPPQRLIKAH
jgi:hypothetical protein